MRVLAATLWVVSPSIKRMIALTSIYENPTLKLGLR